MNRILSFGTGDWYRRHCLERAGLRPGMRVLDVAVGTGLVARQAAAVTGDPNAVIGLDPSAGMLAEAGRLLGIPLIQGVAERLPLADASVDFVSMGYALRHVDDLDVTFREYYRVLRPGGIVLLLEIGKPAPGWRYRLLRIYVGWVVPWLARWAFGGKEMNRLMHYHWETIEQCVPAATILQSLTNSGFTQVECRLDHGVFRAYRGVKNPPAGAPVRDSRG